MADIEIKFLQLQYVKPLIFRRDSRMTWMLLSRENQVILKMTKVINVLKKKLLDVHENKFSVLVGILRFITT